MKTQFKTELVQPTVQDKQTDFFGTTVMSDGHKPEDDKIQNIGKMSKLTSVRDLQCLWLWSTISMNTL